MAVMMNDKSDDLIIRFLLGELPDEERAQVEQRFLSDNDFFEEVLLAEDTLIDQYLLGKLSGERLERAEALFCSSRWQRDEVECTESLIASLRGAAPEGLSAPLVETATPAASVNRVNAEEGPPPARPEPKKWREILSAIMLGLRGWFPRLALLAISLVCLSLLSWVLYHYSQKRGSQEERIAVGRGNQEPAQGRSQENRNDAEPSRQVANEKETQENEKQTQEKARDLTAQMPARKPKGISSILLTPGAPERGGGSKTPVVKIEARHIRLQLALDESWRYRQFSVLITTFDGRRVWSQDSLAAGQIKRGQLILLLPSSLFAPDDYRIELKGLSDESGFVHIADYIFKVRN